MSLSSIAVMHPPLRIDENGAVRIGASRVTLDTLVAAYRDGSTAEEIIHQFPSLDLGDVHATLAYYLHHRGEVDAYLEERMQTADAIRGRVHSPDQRELRDRLIARQASRTS